MLVFGDIDDVLTDFTIFANKYYGINIAYEDIHPQLGRDIIATAQSYGSKGDFWHDLPQRVWADCPKSGVFDLAEGYILTTPRPEPTCAAGKMEWLNRHWKGGHVLTEHKWLLSGPGRVLFDDCEENIAEWRKAGGTGILVPRPWNSMRDYNEIEVIKEALDEISV